MKTRVDPRWDPKFPPKFENDHRRNALSKSISTESNRKNSSVDPLNSERVQKFAQDSTIHGLLQILRPDQTTFGRLVWTTAFLVAVIASTVLIGKSFDRYLKFDVKTTMSSKAEDQIDFPAITFCNENMLKRSLVGASREIIAAFTALIVNSVKDYEKKRDRAFSSCFTNISNEYSAKLSGYGYDFMKQLGLNKLMFIFTFDSYKCVLSCWWQDRWIDCSHLFLNHITDFGWCFTFNPSPKLLKSLDMGFGKDDMAYGVKTYYEPFVLRSTGPNNGLKVLLDTHQDEYCATRTDSAGFRALIHDPSVQPLFSMERPLSLSPGYESNVAIRYTRRIKKTEHLGLCVQNKVLSMYTNAEFYFKEACYLECLTYYIYDRCNCTPLYGPPMANRVLAKQKGYTYVKICWEEMLCMKKQERNFLEAGVYQICADCLDPCESTTYDIQVSTSYFPANNFFHLYDDVLNRTGNWRGMNKTETDKYLRKNLALVNFYVETMQISVITETQAVGPDQLLADIGGQIGFLLGASILSMFEFVDCCLPKKKSLRRMKKPGGGSNPGAKTKSAVKRVSM